MPDPQQVKKNFAAINNQVSCGIPLYENVRKSAFLETSSDLQLQSSTWSNYKHHNTAKFLIGCTPNGAVSFVSSLYVGSISDVELTKKSGLLQVLEGKHNISVMADRGFTIRDHLQAIGVELNIPPFMEGRKQLPADKVL